MLTRLGAAARSWAGVSPWTNVYGLARTLLALSTLGTLLFTASSSLFRPAAGFPDVPNCGGLAGASLFCLVPADQLWLGRLIAIVLLAVVASGWRPQLTAIPHWWVAVSFQASSIIPDGGDQLNAVLTLLILPIALTDRRRWHWHEPAATGADSGHRYAVIALIAWSAALVIRIQVAGVYLQSSVAKLGVEEWADGTALHYWLRDPYFGAPGWLAPMVQAVAAHPVGALALTWGTLVLEFALVLGLIAKRAVRPYLLAAGIALHLSIAVLMGLWSFSIVMIAALVLFLRPVDQPVPTRAVEDRLRWLRHRLLARPGGEPSRPPVTGPVAAKSGGESA
jgi:antimicrobial peptide system SdpB family protein